MTDRLTIAAWLTEGKRRGATHTIIVCDSFDHVDFPVHVMPGINVRGKEGEYREKSMHRVMEVYCHAVSHEEQLNMPRAFVYEPKS